MGQACGISMLGNLNETFAYQTPKVVVLKDAKLGLLRLGLVATIFMYIFVYNVLYQGVHLAEKDINGVYRIALKHPTMNTCDVLDAGCMTNFTPMSQLDYCKQATELPFWSSEGHLQQKLECQLWDSIETGMPVDEGLFIPTRIRRYDQIRSCEPSLANDWACNGVPYDYLTAEGTAQNRSQGQAPQPVYDIFVNDIDHFTLEIDHQFKVIGEFQGDDHQLHGEMLRCPSNNSFMHECTRWEIPCSQELGATCPENFIAPGHKREKNRQLSRDKGMSGVGPFNEDHKDKKDKFMQMSSATRGSSKRALRSQASLSVSDETGRNFARRSGLPAGEPVVSVKRGDLFEIASLMQFANTTLDDEGWDPETTYRHRGLVLVIYIEYKNRPSTWGGLKVLPWSTPELWYTYHVSMRAAYQYKVQKTFDDPADVHRSVREYNGIRVVVEQGGKYVMFEMAHFLIVMTAAMGLLAVATTVTEMAMIYVMDRKDDYYKRKFQQAAVDKETDYAPENMTEAGDDVRVAIDADEGLPIAKAIINLIDLHKKGVK